MTKRNSVGRILQGQKTMSLGLHRDCVKRLSEKIADLLAQVKVKNRVFLDWESAVTLIRAESIMPKSGDLTRVLEEYVGETPLFSFLYNHLSERLAKTQEYDSSSLSLLLQELKGYEDLTAIAQRLVSDFESLPWDYCLTIKFDNRFGDFFARTLKEYSLGDSVRLVSPDDTFERDFPLGDDVGTNDAPSLGDLVGIPGTGPRKWDQSSTYIQVSVDGFMGSFLTTGAISRATSLLKAFCGMGIALQLFEVKHTYRLAPTKLRYTIHHSETGIWVMDRSGVLEATVSDTYRDLCFRYAGEDEQLDSKWVEWVKGRLDKIKCAFENPERARKLLLASQWLFDSLGGTNELLSFVQAMVVLEILLGSKTDSEATGLGALLRNRCAYLISKTHQQREDIQVMFKDIYDVRSKIVHSGKSNLNMRERELFTHLQRMCRRVIQEEVELLVGDERKNK
ncbi:MAG: hypothetical protein KOO62_00515 [candidate division Zixibacteria bacterium]|nr:hypothetical protein [candidate division Zixibacteria bacterium]